MLSCSLLVKAAGPSLEFSRYHSPADVTQFLKQTVACHKDLCQLYAVAKSPGGRDVLLIEIGTEIQAAKKSHPSVFVAANMEGTVPLSTEAALLLIQQILKNADSYREKTWLVLPVGNPDAAQRYFEKPLLMDPRNGTIVNDDMDDRQDEDGNDDLNGDGLITMMRVADPEGERIPLASDPRLMKKAE